MRTIIVLILAIFSYSAQGATTFEGYYKFNVEGQHVGYVILRQDFDPARAEFTSISFTKTSVAVGDITESIIVKADDKFKPKSLNYTYLDKQKKILIDGKMNGENLIVTKTGEGAPQTKPVKIKKGVFFSAFMAQLLLQQGLKTNSKIEYEAIAEETAEVEHGETFIAKEMLDYKNFKVFKLVSKFNGPQYTSYLSPNGETLFSETKSQNSISELVADPEEATKGMPVPKSVITALFGNIPTGKQNIFHKSANTTTNLVTTQLPTKADPPPKAPVQKPKPKKNVTINPPKEAAPPKAEAAKPQQGIVIKTQTVEIPTPKDGNTK